MKVYLHRLMAAASLVCLILVSAPALAAVDSKQVLDHIDDLYRGKSAKGIMSMAVTTKHWKRTLRDAFLEPGQGTFFDAGAFAQKGEGHRNLAGGQKGVELPAQGEAGDQAAFLHDVSLLDGFAFQQ
jgi:hypothetical protein